MKIEKIPTKRSKIITDYLSGNDKLSGFYAFSPTLEGLEKSLRTRQFSIDKRNVLSKELSKQYENLEASEETLQNIKLLQHTTTYTITTGHQLSVFTGPLFFIYKIISTIRLCKEMKSKFPLYDFVPIYWMASEDHDFEEINHFHLFNQKHTWENEQKGAVGEFKMEGFESVFEDIKEELPLFKKAYLESDNLSEATQYLVNELFKQHGLVILEPNNTVLKSQFKDIIRDELSNHTSFTEINNSSEKLVKAGYKAQINSREINLFYLDNQLRERIVFEGDKYKVNNTDISFSKDEILELVDSNPEKFSPNVALRPVYQEAILPNLAYIGGPGELAYWLQLKSNFDRLAIPFPVLLLRDSFLLLNKGSQKTIEKLNISLEDIFKDYDILKKELVKKWSDGELHLDSEKREIESVMLSIKEKAMDKSLHPAIESELQKINKGLDNLEKRIHKAEERNHETALSQLKKLQEKLKPNGVPQERVDNILNYSINDDEFISKIYEGSDLLDTDLKVVYL